MREEILQQLIVASKSIGETKLEAKLEEAVSKIKRHNILCIFVLVTCVDGVMISQELERA